ncbi:FabD/lysophospholipase-like protein [Mycena sanguinolenta]|uniref:FabD/lysophospholipase-like protein n=1 Tax=Mycena sanguinolenta TaxID=230812 RepID=A0A8H7D0L5_9AGAR|nr:FabD/lysophospholipase-like protein [Mycena sanguinolenta]
MPGVVNTYNNYYISGGRGGSGGMGGLFGGRGGTGEGPIIQLPQPPLSAAMVQAAQVYLNHCPPASSIFQGRQAILEAMHQFFAQDTQKRKIYVLYGLGGIGKTQIALKFIQDSNCFTEKFLVDASSTESIETGLKNIATANQIGNSSQDALAWLAGKHRDWLVFFDNADEPEMNLQKVFPKCTHGNIIITTRNPGLRVYGGYSQVSDMEESDAVALLLQRACHKPSAANEALAVEIVKELAYLPLAIIQAGAFISESGSLDTFLGQYRTNQTKLLKRKPAQCHDDYAWTVYTTWQMSFDRLDRPATTFLLLCSFLHRDGITEDIFSGAAKLVAEPDWVYLGSVKSKSALDIAEDFLSHFLAAGKWDSLCFVELTNKLKAYSLINFDPERKSFSIHPLVHSWSQTILDNPQSYAECMNHILGTSIMQLQDKDREMASLRLISHVQFFMQAAPDADDKFHQHYANVHREAGHYATAMELDIRTLDKRRKLLGDDHKQTLQAMYNLAITYDDLGQFDKAKELAAAVLGKRRQLLGDDHLGTLWAMNNLATIHQHLGQFEKAKELRIGVLEVWKNLLGDDHWETLAAMNNLGGTYIHLDQLQEAEKLLDLVVEKSRKLSGNDNLTLTAMDNLASAYEQLGKLEEAEKLRIVVLEKGRKIFGDHHWQTLNTMHKLAMTYQTLGQFEEAEKLQVVVLEQRIKLLGDDHVNTLQAMDNLGWTYYCQNHFAEAEEILVAALDKLRSFVSDNHQDTQCVLKHLVWTYHALNKQAEASELEKLIRYMTWPHVQSLEDWEELLKKHKQLLGDNFQTLNTMDALARRYHNLGQFEEAEKLQVVVVEKRGKLLGDDHLHTLDAMVLLGVIYCSQRHFAKAEDILLAAFEKFRMLVGEDHLDTQHALHNLVETYQQLNKKEEVAELKRLIHNNASPQGNGLENLEELLKKQRTVLGNDHWQTLNTMQKLASAYGSSGRFEEAEKLQVLVLEKRTKLLGDDHLDTLLAMNNLGWTYYCQNRFVEAEEILIAALDKLRSLVGDDHPDTQRVLQNLVWTYRRLTKWDEAAELEKLIDNDAPEQEQSLEELEHDVKTKREFLGDNNFQTLRAMHNLAIRYDSLGQFEEAEKLRVVVLGERRELLGDDHLDTLLAMNNLGWTYYCQDRFVEAEKILVVALDKHRRLLGDDNVYTLITMRNVARTYNHLGRFKEDEELTVVLLEQQRKLLGDDHLATLVEMNNLGYTYYCQRRFVEAEKILVAALNKLRSIVGNDHPDTQRVLKNLAATYRKLNQPSRASELAKLILK